MSIEVNTNNPLGLTVAGPGYGNPDSYLYNGQIGAQTSGLGYTFAQFPDQQTGINAGIAYITNKINTGQVTTVHDLVNLFSPNDLPAFEQTTGLSSGTTLDASQAPLYAAGIAAGEGTLQAFGGVSAFTGGSTATSGPATSGASTSDWISRIEQWFSQITASVTFVILGLIVLIGAIIIFAQQQGAFDNVKVPPLPVE